MDGQQMAAHTLSMLFLQEVTGAGMAQLTLTFHPLLESEVFLKVQVARAALLVTRAAC